MNQAIARALRMARHPAAAVASGILASRLVGLLRVRAFSYYFGLQSDAADAFNAAFRIPNLLQNLFGEGALSGSFIPVYSGLRARQRPEEAAQMARTVFALLALIVSVLTLAGVVGASWVIAGLAPGFEGSKRALTITLVRILFPGAGVLVLSAWCLGVLNVHGRFLLSYAAPIAWNVAMIATLVIFGRDRDLPELAVYLAWGSVVGSLAQLGVQLRQAWMLSRGGPGLALTPPVREAVRNFGPVLASRGAVQLTAYIDTVIASLLPTGAVTGLTNTQLLYTLPVSLFGISISSAALPSIAADAHASDALERVRVRVAENASRIAYFTIPSAASFLALGDVLAATLLQTGRFTAADSRYVWGILAGSAVGLVAATTSRLYGVAHYALGDTKTPLRFTVARLVLATVLGYIAAVWLPGWLGLELRWGAAGLTASAGIAGWIELALLRTSLQRRVGEVTPSSAYLARLWIAGALAGLGSRAVRMLLPPLSPLVVGALVLPLFGGLFLGLSRVAGVPFAGRTPRT
ncbi:MAG TPA: murein biosynthesis integral membrane protein MurJ [Chloroflexota bacterium]|nr:murein biosynthesis integral membrane protein MurJ [Chloroflexota bacterium]